MIEPETLAYIAAVLDTQARITTMETSGGTVLPLVALSCPNMKLLEFLGSLTGMQPFTTKRSYDKHRCSLHCDAAHDHVVSQSGRWSISGAKATVVLAAIQPYVRFQTEEVSVALKAGLEAPKKKATPEKMKQLGWPIPDSWV